MRVCCCHAPGRYDSEEEKFAARQQAARRGAAVRAEAAAQLELLGAYRSHRDARRHLTEEALQSKLRQQWRGGAGEWREGDAADAGWHTSPGWVGGAATNGGAAPSAAQLRQLRQHEHRWEALTALAASDPAGACQGREAGAEPAGAAMLRLADVPWPPLGCHDYLRCLAALERQDPQQQQQQHGTEDAEGRRAARRAYARACLRWHPDKFVARWGALLAEGERTGILQRVQQLSQALNEAWGTQQQEWAAHRDGLGG